MPPGARETAGRGVAIPTACGALGCHAGRWPRARTRVRRWRPAASPDGDGRLAAAESIKAQHAILRIGVTLVRHWSPGNVSQRHCSPAAA
jgi:hypothetical protein